MSTTTKMSLEDLVRDRIGKDTPLEELVKANKFLVAEIRLRQQQENRKALADFRPNDKVQLKEQYGSAKLPGGAVGIVKRLGIKNITVDFGIYRAYRVPAGQLEAAPENASFLPKDRASAPSFRPSRRSRTRYEETPPEMA